jgi:hypothetical protein
MKTCHCCGNKHTQVCRYCPDCHTCVGECDWHGTQQELEELGLIEITILFTEEAEEERGWPRQN